MICLDLDLLRKASKYKSTDPARERVIPTDEEIEAWLDGFENRAQQWIFAMMATYGLRPHETFHVETCSLQPPSKSVNK